MNYNCVTESVSKKYVNEKLSVKLNKSSTDACKITPKNFQRKHWYLLNSIKYLMIQIYFADTTD